MDTRPLFKLSGKFISAALAEFPERLRAHYSRRRRSTMIGEGKKNGANHPVPSRRTRFAFDRLCRLKSRRWDRRWQEAVGISNERCKYRRSSRGHDRGINFYRICIIVDLSSPSSRYFSKNARSQDRFSRAKLSYDKRAFEFLANSALAIFAQSRN